MWLVPVQSYPTADLSVACLEQQGRNFSILREQNACNSGTHARHRDGGPELRQEEEHSPHTHEPPKIEGGTVRFVFIRSAARFSLMEAVVIAVVVIVANTLEIRLEPEARGWGGLSLRQFPVRNCATNSTLHLLQQ